MAVLFISTNYAKENSVIDENADDKFIKRAIIKAQDIDLQELLGTDLLDELKDQVENSTLTAANTTLLNSFVLPYLTAQVVATSVVPLQFKLRNKAIGTMSDENFTSVNTPDLNLVLRQYQNEAQFHGERLRKYLLANTTTYPLYMSGNTDAWKIRPIRTAYQTGLFLGLQRKPWSTYNQSSLDRDMYDGPCCYYR